MIGPGGCLCTSPVFCQGTDKEADNWLSTAPSLGGEHRREARGITSSTVVPGPRSRSGTVGYVGLPWSPALEIPQLWWFDPRAFIQRHEAWQAGDNRTTGSQAAATQLYEQDEGDCRRRAAEIADDVDGRSRLSVSKAKLGEFSRRTPTTPACDQQHEPTSVGKPRPGVHQRPAAARAWATRWYERPCAPLADRPPDGVPAAGRSPISVAR